MVPSITILKKYNGVQKKRILDDEYVIEELKGKVGLFIIQLEGNGKMSRVIIKKGSLTFIHRDTAAGHIGYIIDSDRNICKADKTGIWIDKKFYKCNPDKNGSIFIPYGND